MSPCDSCRQFMLTQIFSFTLDIQRGKTDLQPVYKLFNLSLSKKKKKNLVFIISEIHCHHWLFITSSLSSNMLDRCQSYHTHHSSSRSYLKTVLNLLPTRLDRFQIHLTLLNFHTFEGHREKSIDFELRRAFSIV